MDALDYVQQMIYPDLNVLQTFESYCDPKQTNEFGETVASILLDKKIIPPKFWITDDMLESNPLQYSDLLKQRGKIIIPITDGGYYMNSKPIDKQIALFKTYTANDICAICLNEGEQKFIVYDDKHKHSSPICVNCANQLKYNTKCPICRQTEYKVWTDDAKKYGFKFYKI